MRFIYYRLCQKNLSASFLFIKKKKNILVIASKKGYWTKTNNIGSDFHKTNSSKQTRREEVRYHSVNVKTTLFKFRL